MFNVSNFSPSIKRIIKISKEKEVVKVIHDKKKYDISQRLCVIFNINIFLIFKSHCQSFIIFLGASLLVHINEIISTFNEPVPDQPLLNKALTCR